MSAFAQPREILKELYGLEFPDGLFHLHQFFAALSSEECDALGMHPSGLLEVLGLPRERLAALKPKLPMLLHWRFYRDPPEFFSCLHGECDGEHWGILLDDPARGFRGMAAYYNNDADRIRVFASPFAAVLRQLDRSAEGYQENVRYDPGEAGFYRRRIRLLGAVRERLDRYIAEHGVPLDDGRPLGVPHETGLSLIVPGRKKTAPSAFKGPGALPELVREALAECEAGRPLAALSVGRSLHHGGGREHSAGAHRLLRAAYLALGRDALVRVLDVHHQHRDLPNVNILRDD